MSCPRLEIRKKCVERVIVFGCKHGFLIYWTTDYVMVTSQRDTGTNILLDSSQTSADYLQKPQVNNICGKFYLQELLPAETFTCGRCRQLCLRQFYRVEGKKFTHIRPFVCVKYTRKVANSDLLGVWLFIELYFPLITR